MPPQVPVHALHGRPYPLRDLQVAVHALHGRHGLHVPVRVLHGRHDPLNDLQVPVLAPNATMTSMALVYTATLTPSIA
jgi:hypothetical protein